MSRKINLLNHKFRGGVVLLETDERDNKSIVYICKCTQCGNEDWKLSARRIKHESPISCGCLDNRGIGATKHGMSKSGKTRFYRIWCKMKSRCYSDDDTYKTYKERGITVCEVWRSDFIKFKEDMYSSYTEACLKWGESKTSLDRIDPNKNYNAINCRWANPNMQTYNRDYTKHTKSKFILAKRLSDGYEIITVNAKIFSRMLFNTPNNHIHDVCKRRTGRNKERGWVFDYISKEEYFKLKDCGLDYIENIEIFHINIPYSMLEIETSGEVHMKKSEYIETQRSHFINNNGKVVYGTRREVFIEFNFESILKMRNAERLGKEIRKLTSDEVEKFMNGVELYF